MTLPSPLGLNPFGAGSTVERVHALLRRLHGEGGYPTDDDSNWSRELEAYATALATGGAMIERAGQQGFVSLATDMLDELEREVYLPNDAARDDQERQLRLAALERANAGADEAHVEASIRLLTDVTAEATSVLRTVVADEKTADAAIFLVALQLSLADYGSPYVRRAIGQLARRMLPARYGQPAVASGVEDPVVGTVGAIWAEATHLLDRDALRASRGGASAVTAPTHPPARLVDFGNLSKLRSRDLNEIQARLLACSVNGVHADVTTFGGMVGMDEVAFALSVANGATAEVDSSVDWRDRLVVVALAVDDTDIRPGQAADTSFNDAAVAAQTRALWYTGTGGASYELVLEANLVAQVNSGAPYGVRVINTTGGTRRVAGMLLGSTDLGKR
ncbi:MAG: hypothetical protein IT379_39365 [Deltaproteobacteria bacterium]|nr:hypothetical protein [Deltaproteobacteria bacterium]